MRRLASLAVVMAVSACASSTPAGSGASAPKTVFEIRAGYDSAFLAPAANYRQLPVCAPVAVQPCHDPKVVAQLVKADTAAKAALDAAEDVARNTPAVDSATAIRAATDATEAAVAILAAYQIK